MESPGTIDIKIKSQDGREKTYRISQHTKMGKLLAKYCTDIEFDPAAVAFLIKGDHFSKDKSPAELKLKNGTVIDALMHMHGGGSKALSVHA